MAKVTAPGHPSIQTLLWSTDAVILKIAEQVYRGCSGTQCAPPPMAGGVYKGAMPGMC